MTTPAEAPTISINPPEGFTYEAGKPITLPASAIDLRQLAPKEIAEKDYFKKITTAEDLFKSFDGAQTLLGKKPAYTAPAADATPEEWEKFLGSLRPEKADAYEFEDAKDVPAELKASDEYKTEVRQLLHAAGLTPYQAKILQKGWDALQLKQFQAHKTKVEGQDKEMADFMGKTFGDKAPEMVERAKGIFAYILPKEMHGGLDKLPNEALQYMAVFANSIADKYMKEDEIPKGEGTGGKTADDLRKQAQGKMVEMRKLDAMDPKKQTLQTEINSLYEQISKMQK